MMICLDDINYAVAKDGEIIAFFEQGSDARAFIKNCCTEGVFLDHTEGDFYIDTRVETYTAFTKFKTG